MAKPEAEPRQSTGVKDMPANEPMPDVKTNDRKTTSNGPQQKSAGKAVKSESVNADNGVQVEMPKHDSPDQEKIDSIKQAKQKDKK